MMEGVRAKHKCVIKNYFFNFDEVWSKRENEEHDV
jgi:hypothetical protein